jgi:hypothetical protein
MSLAADSRRARYSLLRTADLSGSRSPYQEPFPISPFTFVRVFRQYTKSSINHLSTCLSVDSSAANDP